MGSNWCLGTSIQNLACQAAAGMSVSAVSLYELMVVTSNDLYFPHAFILIASFVCTAILPSNEVKQSNGSVIFIGFLSLETGSTLPQLFISSLNSGLQFASRLPHWLPEYQRGTIRCF